MQRDPAVEKEVQNILREAARGATKRLVRRELLRYALYLLSLVSIVGILHLYGYKIDRARTIGSAQMTDVSTSATAHAPNGQ